mmetsp:Transcript_56582/g.160581  ORF Transcript_56582/g.160581 Transcript_56582/m.160581 type:complete len:206 (-) Transcript_56582:151-768(-)
MMGWLALLSSIICSSSFSNGTLPAAAWRSCALRSILQLFTSSCAILRMRSAFGTVLPGQRTSTSRSFTGLTRANTSAYEMSPGLTDVREDSVNDVWEDLPESLLSDLLPPSSLSSLGRFRPSTTSLATPAHSSARLTSQSQRSPRLATPMYLNPRFLAVSCVYGLSPEISRNMYHIDPMSMNGSSRDGRKPHFALLWTLWPSKSR